MDRRQLLFGLGSFAAAVSLSLAGCTQTREGESDGGDAARGSAYDVEIEMEAVSDTELVKKAVAGDRLHQRDKLFVSSVIEDGPVTLNDSRQYGGRYFLQDGSIFEFSKTVVHSEPAQQYRFTLQPMENGVASGNRILFSDLPSIDQKALEEQYGWEPGKDIIAGGVAIVYSTDGINDSILVPDPQYSIIERQDGTQARLTVDSSINTTVNTYRYDAELAYKSSSKLANKLKEDFAFTLTNLSTEEDEIVSQTINHDFYRIYSTDHPQADAFRSIAERFGSHAGIQPGKLKRMPPETMGGHYIVRYRGKWYWVSLSGRALN